MCGVIVVDAESFWSTWHGRDAYVQDHCLRYHHNYAHFYQLLGGNLFTHRIICYLERSQPMALGSLFHYIEFLLHHTSFRSTILQSFTFRSINQKYQKYLLYLLFSLFSLYEISLLQVTMKGLTTPLSRWVQVCWLFVQVFGDLCVISYWIDTLVLSLREILTLLCYITLSSPREKLMQAQEVAGRISGAIAGEIYAKSRHTEYPL